VKHRNPARYKVMDRATVLSIVNQAVDREGVRGAAKRGHTSPAQVSRFRRHPPQEFRAQTFRWLMRLAPTMAARTMLEASVLTPEARARLQRRTDEWLRELANHTRHLLANWRDSAAIRDIVGIQTLAPLVRAIEDINPLGDLSPGLLFASWWRVIEPLVKGTPLGREWREMPREEVKAFIAAGIARERILLLRRPSPLLEAVRDHVRRKLLGLPPVPRTAQQLYRLTAQELYRLEKAKRSRARTR